MADEGNVMDVINDKLSTACGERMVSMSESTLEALRNERDARHAEARMLRERCRCGLATCQQYTTALVCLDCYNAVTRERDEARAQQAKWEELQDYWEARALTAESERDAARAVLRDISAQVPLADFGLQERADAALGKQDA